MGEFFDEFKRYVVEHPRVVEYKPAHEKFDADKLQAVGELLVKKGVEFTEDDIERFIDFVKFSGELHGIYLWLYDGVKRIFQLMSLRGREVAEYLVAVQNRDYYIVGMEHANAIKNADKGTYFMSDMLDFKVMSPDPGIGLMDVRGAFECSTDSVGLVLNYLRFFLDEDFSSENHDPDSFAGYFRRVYEMTQKVVVLKHSYDDILYNGGFVSADNERRCVILDFDNHRNRKLLRAGDMMLTEHGLQTMEQNRMNGIVPRFFRYLTNRRIKKVKVEKGCVSLDFGQSDPKPLKSILTDIQAALDAYYEFLDGATVLPSFCGCTIDEAITVWCVIRYIAHSVSTGVDLNVALYTREDFDRVPRKIRKEDLVSYIATLVNVRSACIRAVVDALSADWRRFNDIWSSMLYPSGDSLLMPFYPLIMSAPYNIIDSLLAKGGFDLEDRGKQFENYLYRQLTAEPSRYPIECLPAGKYGSRGQQEEIDLIIGMKNVVLVADAKCIRYSMEPFNYADAWDRLAEGCVQAVRKMEFVRNNHQLFSRLGNIASKRFIPMVITNYPAFTGFCYDGAYVIDSHSFLAYIHSGLMTMRELSESGNEILKAGNFYSDEDEFSDRFADYLADNPHKKRLMRRICMYDLPLSVDPEGWSILCHSARVENDPRFNVG